MPRPQPALGLGIGFLPDPCPLSAFASSPAFLFVCLFVVGVVVAIKSTPIWEGKNREDGALGPEDKISASNSLESSSRCLCLQECCQAGVRPQGKS